MVLDFAKDAFEKIPPKRVCFKCKRDISDSELAVCDFFVTLICEYDVKYECSSCWTSQEREDFERERFTRQILQQILSERSK